MDNYKFTKGKWQIAGSENTFVYALNEKGTNAFSLNINNDGKTPLEEQQANALLISKAPEMLEMLKYFTAFPDEDFEEDMDKHISFPMTVDARKIKEAKQLIKEATEL